MGSIPVGTTRHRCGKPAPVFFFSNERPCFSGSLHDLPLSAVFSHSTSSTPYLSIFPSPSVSICLSPPSLHPSPFLSVCLSPSVSSSFSVCLHLSLPPPLSLRPSPAPLFLSRGSFLFHRSIFPVSPFHSGTFSITLLRLLRTSVLYLRTPSRPTTTPSRPNSATSGLSDITIPPLHSLRYGLPGENSSYIFSFLQK